MTAISPATGRGEPGSAPDGRLSWRRLASVTLRQHKGSLAAYLAFAALVAVAMAVTGLVQQASGQNVVSVGRHSPWPLYGRASTALSLVLPLMPVLAGMFLGAPLVAREIETGAARFTWTQGAGRTRWLLASVMPVALILAIIAAGLALEWRWWTTPLTPFAPPWRNGIALSPLPFTGWMLACLSVGVALGAAIRRTVPAMAAALACGLVGMYVAITWQRDYLPPLHQRAVGASIGAGGSYGYGVPFSSRGGPGQEILGSALGWPDGRLLTRAELHHPAAWFRAHDIQVWLTYQPASRFILFGRIEFGWLIALSALLIGLTVLLIHRGTS